MLARVRSAAVAGVEGFLVEVETDLAPGLPYFCVVGLPGAAVRESRERVVAAIRNSGFDFPVRKITVNLAPAGVRKEGARYDLPLALGILLADGQVRGADLEGLLVLGELALDGGLRPVRGALPMTAAARAAGFGSVLLPAVNAAEAALVEGMRVLPADTLLEAARLLVPGEREGFTGAWNGRGERRGPTAPDFADVRGQGHAKRAIQIAAAGNHNVLFLGPPGTGKTMLAQRLPGILPPLSRAEAIEVSSVYSVAGLLPEEVPLIEERPFRAPHHSISRAGLVGGGAGPRPGEVSLAHHGVLFLDELPEFSRGTLEALRQPLEDGVVTIVRAERALTFPARFTLAAAMNPCACGHLGDPRRACRCTTRELESYRARVSGPLLDRIDIHVEVPPVTVDTLIGEGDRIGTAELREAVLAARARQDLRNVGECVVRAQGSSLEGSPAGARAGDTPGAVPNAHLGPRGIERHCRLGPQGEALLRAALEQLGLSARGVHRVLKVARTVADLAGSEAIADDHLAEAIQYRALDREVK